MPENSPWKAGYSMPKPPTTVAGKGVRVTQGQSGTTVVEQRRRNEFKSGERASRPASLPPPGGTGTALWTAWLEDNGVTVNPPVASMIVEFERKAVLADMCSLGAHMDDETYVVKETTVNTFEHGTQTITLTAAGNIRTWHEGDTPDACETPVYEAGSTAGLGSFVSSAFTEETQPFSDVWDAAVAALASAPTTAPTEEFAWPESLWQATTVAGAWSYSMGYIGCTGGGDSTCVANSFRWRVKNTGQCDIKLFWERRLVDDDSLVTDGTLNISQGTTSGWQEPPATPADPDARIYVTLSAIEFT